MFVTESYVRKLTELFGRYVIIASAFTVLVVFDISPVYIFVIYSRISHWPPYVGGHMWALPRLPPGSCLLSCGCLNPNSPDRSSCIVFDRLSDCTGMKTAAEQWTTSAPPNA